MEKQIVTLTLIQHKIREYEGKEFKNCSVQCKEITDDNGEPKYISGYANNMTYSWRLGDEVELAIEENDRGYLNFKTPSKREVELAEEVERLAKQNKVMKETLKDKDVDLDDLPF